MPSTCSWPPATGCVRSWGPTLGQRSPRCRAGCSRRPDIAGRGDRDRKSDHAPGLSSPRACRPFRGQGARAGGAGAAPLLDQIGDAHRTRRRRQVAARGRNAARQAAGGAPAGSSSWPRCARARRCPATIAAAVGLQAVRRHRPAASPVRATWLTTSALLVLDNLEHLAGRTPGRRRPATQRDATCTSCSPRASRCARRRAAVPGTAPRGAAPPSTSVGVATLDRSTRCGCWSTGSTPT